MKRKSIKALACGLLISQLGLGAFSIAHASPTAESVRVVEDLGKTNDLEAAYLACRVLAGFEALKEPALRSSMGDKSSVELLAERKNLLAKDPVVSIYQHIVPGIAPALRNLDLMLKQQAVLQKVNETQRGLHRDASDLLEVAEDVFSHAVATSAPAPRVAAASQLKMLTQRIALSASEFMSAEGVSPEAVFLLGKDLGNFQEIARGLLDGNALLRLTSEVNPRQRQRLSDLLKVFDATRARALVLLVNLQGIVAAREVHLRFQTEVKTLAKVLEPTCMPK
jgi:hypothetical protein